MAKKERTRVEAPAGDVGGDYGRRYGKSMHDYGGAHEPTRSHNSYAERNQISGPGPVEGAGEVDGAGPGRAAVRYVGDTMEGKPQPTPSGKPGKGMKTIRDE